VDSISQTNNNKSLLLFFANNFQEHSHKIVTNQEINTSTTPSPGDINRKTLYPLSNKICAPLCPKSGTLPTDYRKINYVVVPSPIQGDYCNSTCRL